MYQVGMIAVSIGVGIMTARMLGVYDRGVYVLGFLPGQFLASLASSPLGDALLYMSARDENARAQVMRSAIVLSIFATGAIMLLLGLLYLIASGSVLQGVPLDVFLVASAATPCYVLGVLG